MFSRLPQLDERLSLVMSMVRSGICVADIGTDHAYLPLHLVVDGQASKVYACDINEGPLASARDTVARFKMQPYIETVLSDGLEKVPVEEVDDIIIAGMGGELIASIIDREPRLKDGTKRLILQPMTMADKLRRYLYENGFSIIDENAARDGGHVYTVLCARFTGETRQIDEITALVGLLPRRSSAAASEYIHIQAEKLRKKGQGLSLTLAGEEEGKRLLSLADEIDSLTGEDEAFMKWRKR